MWTPRSESDGTVSLMLNGQTPLLLEDKQFPLTTSLYQPQDPPPTNASGPASVRIQASGWQRHHIPNHRGPTGCAAPPAQSDPAFYYRRRAIRPASLNVMAKQFADRVNQLLTSGNITDGPPAQPGSRFSPTTPTDATAAAASLSVDPAVTPDQLATISPGPPAVSNGVPLALSALASPVQDADKVNGLSYSQFYGQIAGSVGTALNDATNNQDVQQSLLSQAKDLRQQYQGVSLDEEATILMQFQRAYQANSKFLTVLDQLTNRPSTS